MALQEVFSIVDADIFQLENYHSIQFKTRTLSKVGGVAFYILKSFKCSTDLSISAKKTVSILRMLISCSVPVPTQMQALD